MIAIMQERNSGKSRKLLELAAEHDATVVTQNKRALKEKAKAYGIKGIDIIDYDDLWNDNYDIYKPIFIHNGDKMLAHLFDKFYNLKVAGFSATINED